MAESKRKHEIGTTLFSWERDKIVLAAKSRKAKLATYVRERLLEIAERDLAESQTSQPAGGLTAEEKAAMTSEVADQVLRLLGERLLPPKKDPAE